MTNNLDINLLRKKLAYKANRRGAKELDIIFTNLINKHLHKMDLKLLKQFEELLTYKDLEIYRQFMGYEKLNNKLNNELWQLLKVCNKVK